jgi:hypothetical protein
MTNFATLKKSSMDISRLTQEIEKINNPSSGERKEDERFWKPEVDKAGNGYAVIRFLPAPAVDGDEALPWVRVWDHGFQGPTGKWYIEKSLNTIGQKDPVADFNSKLWNSTTDDNSPERKQARLQKRRLYYLANIYVVSDPKNPDNEGKVFLYKFGKKIFDKITGAMNPEFEDEQPLNPFDLWNGANFKLKIRQVEGYRNYDKSEFDSVSEIGSSDEERESIWNSEHSLKEFVDPANFKSYDELKSHLDKVLGIDTASQSSAPAPVAKPKPAASFADDDDDDLEMFKALADD